MSRYCDDCGTRMSDGMCPNCHEELFIAVTQDEDMPDVWSEDFARKVEEQGRAVRQLNKEPQP